MSSNLLIQTTSVMIQSLCVPCSNHCRYCLLSWCGKTDGADWDRCVRLAERYLTELREALPKVSCNFSFGYSMEHPDLRDAIRTLRRLGSPTAEFLQCDGMRMRNDDECGELMAMLREEGIEQLSFTIYGLKDYHDRFAGRKGDYELLTRMMKSATKEGLPFGVRIPVTGENIEQAEKLVEIMESTGSKSISLFVPNEEGRGKNLENVRLSADDLVSMRDKTRKHLNETVYRTEADWLSEKDPVQDTKRSILISLRKDNIDELEKKDPLTVLKEIEELDERYYASFPSFRELAGRYGDPDGKKLYRIRDLYYHYRRVFAEENALEVYDVTDERFSGSRRFS